ncbi:MAG: hypothetical protein KAG82_01080 [Alcanivoracaceae bacterium]|nr:hypothetical protein [Alcanivoracaceae bacterium]
MLKRWLVIAAVDMVVLGSAASASADIWSDPHPFRREALIEGRDFEYDSRSFLNRLSYRPLFTVPAGGDGIFGSAGSVTSTELYLDVAVQQTLRFDDQRHSVRLNYRRSEDYDGYFDQQRFGYGMDVADLRLAVSGDVRGDKAETDVYFEADWMPSEDAFWRVNLILPDAYLNQKGESEAEYLTSARSWFVEWRQQWLAWQWRVAINTTPTIRLFDSVVDQAAQAEQHRGMLELSVGEKWHWQLRAEGERADRQFVIDPDGLAEEKAFRRRMHAVTTSVQATQWQLTPTFGVYYLRLEEDGWTGLARSLTVADRYEESYAFVALNHSLTQRWQWQPAVYVGLTQQHRSAEEDPDRNSRTDRFQGKLSLPFSYLAKAETGAYLSLSPSFYLHRAAFGGGNLQLHWPF